MAECLRKKDLTKFSDHLKIKFDLAVSPHLTQKASSLGLQETVEKRVYLSLFHRILCLKAEDLASVASVTDAPRPFPRPQSVPLYSDKLAPDR
jgi:hypothetical protein